jgi:hypothetical protein
MPVAGPPPQMQMIPVMMTMDSYISLVGLQRVAELAYDDDQLQDGDEELLLCKAESTKN